ncbi:MAG: Cell division protein FtsW, partial [uncultured Quadrisphaera sp.]
PAAPPRPRGAVPAPSPTLWRTLDARLGWLTGGPLPERFARWDTPATTYYVLQGAVTLLVLVGLVMVLSSSFVESIDDDRASYALAVKQAVFAAAGAVVLAVVSRVPIAWWRPALRLPALAVVGAAALQLLVFTPLGVEVGGNRNWIGVGGFTLQPSELVKLSAVLWCAAVLTHQRRHLHRLLPAVVPVAVGVGPGILLVLAGRDLGTSLVLGLVVAAALFVAGAPLRHLAALAVPVLLAVAALVVADPDRLGRFASFTGGHTDAEGVGWQSLHGLYALASGGLTGVGLGASREKWSWLPEAHNDFIFAIVGEELGLLGALSVLALFAVVAWSCARVVRASDDLFVKVLVGSVMAWVLGQAAINIAVVTGMAPVVGVPLPLISSGGSALLATMAALGLVLACVRSLPGASRALRARPGLVRRSLAV